MTKFTAIALIIASSFLAVGCGQAVTLKQDAHAGTIALEGSYMEAMSDARLMAAEHCGGRFDVIELGDTLAYRCQDGGEIRSLVAAR